MITGNAATRNVFINTVKLDPAPSQKLYNHSPDGFAWGYSGSGPAQLALALLLYYSDAETAVRFYQDFKHQVIAALPKGSFVLDESEVLAWIGMAETMEEQAGQEV